MRWVACRLRESVLGISTNGGPFLFFFCSFGTLRAAFWGTVWTPRSAALMANEKKDKKFRPISLLLGSDERAAAARNELRLIAWAYGLVFMDWAG
jgi:hypothetical protein